MTNNSLYILFGLVLAATSLISPSMIYAQGTAPDNIYFASGDPSNNQTKTKLIEYAISKIRNMTDPMIRLEEKGYLAITSTTYDENGNYVVDSVGIHHPWTKANGYNIDDNQLIAPNGTVVIP